MRILFIHNKAPKPFRHIAQEYASDSRNKVLYLAEQCSKEYKIPKVRHIGLPKLLSPSNAKKNEDIALTEFQCALQNASTVANALLRLKRSGFIPDIIYTSPLGGSLYVKDIFPDTFMITHANWFYSMNESYNFLNKEKPRSSIQFAPARIRNLFQFNALNDSNLSITSTEWQKQQYPKEIRNKIIVSPEGIDTEMFSPKEIDLYEDINIRLNPDDKLVTFFCKNAVAYRGFSQFLNCIPTLLGLDSKCHILICGLDKKLFEHQLMSIDNADKDKIINSKRIHVQQGLTPRAYLQILRASTVHVYLTAPYALSSSILEALSCSCMVVGSDTAPVREIISHNHNGFLNDFWNSEALAQTIADCLKNIEQLQHIKKNARSTILNNYNKKILTNKHLQLVSNSFNYHNNK